MAHGEAMSFHSVRFCLSSFSLCCCGYVHFMWNRKVPELDVLLWFHRDVHVLLRPLADLRVRHPPLWLVSRTFSSARFFLNGNADAALLVYNCPP